ncbi:MAG: hypothetical protein ABI211_18140 [Vicinamibacterales bacterium]
MALSEPRPTVRPGFRRVAIAACLVLAPVAIWTAWDYLEARRLASAVAQVRLRGEPVAPPDKSAPDVGAPDNAARYYTAAAALVITDGLYGPTGVLTRLDTRPTPPESVLGDVRAFLETNSEAEALLAKATEMEFRGYLAGFDYNYRADRLWMLTAIANLRAFERAMVRDGDGAATAVVRQLRVARPLGWSASSAFIDVTSGLGTYGVVSAASELAMILPLEPSPAALAQVQANLEALDTDGAIAEVLMSDQARLLGAYWDDAHQWYARLPREFAPFTGPWFLLLRPWTAHQVVAHAWLLGDQLAEARRPWPERLHVTAPAEAEAPATRGRQLPWSMIPFAPGLDLTRAMHRARTERIASTLAIVRVAIVATAVARYRLAHAATLPATLDELTPELLPSLPIDPYSGKSLRYAKQDSGFVVYSIGRNETDDDGKELNQQLSKRWGPYSRARETADIGLRVEFNRAAPR